jgi:hypothetical protein
MISNAISVFVAIVLACCPRQHQSKQTPITTSNVLRGTYSIFCQLLNRTPVVIVDRLRV